MSADADSDVLTAADFMKQRNESTTELVKALLIVNGGSAVALLAFLQAIWIPSRVLAKPVVTAIAVLAVGALLAAAIHLVRHEAIWQFQQKRRGVWAAMRVGYIALSVCSLLAFIAGVAVVCTGVLRAL